MSSPTTDLQLPEGMTAPEVMTYAQFAAKHKLVTDYDVQGHIHAGLMAAHMPTSYHRRYQKRLAELQNARDEGRRRYREAVDRGEIVAPVELTHRQRLELTAGGDPEFPSTQAARRTLARIKEREASQQVAAFDRAIDAAGGSNGE